MATATIADPDQPEHDDLAALRAIVEGTARNTGEEFTLAYWFRDRFHPNIEFDLADTPCADVADPPPRSQSDDFC
jgi:hypothetical protein